MTRRALPQAHTKRELHQHFAHHPNLASTRTRGRHTIYTGRNGFSVPVANGNGDVPRGTLASIVRMASLAGLAALVLAVVVGFV